MIKNKDLIYGFCIQNDLQDVTDYSKDKFLDYQIKYNVALQNIRFEVMKSYDLRIYKAKSTPSKKSDVIFTFIYFIFNSRLDYIKNSLKSICEQTWEKIEVIFVFNGIREIEIHNIKEILSEVQNVINRNISIQIIDVTKNLWEPLSEESKDPFTNLWNLATWIAEGDFITFLSWDDLISRNYCTEMIGLLQSNEECLSAAPLPVSIDLNGNVNVQRSAEFQKKNIRERYTLGHILVNSYIENENLIRFPGEIMCFNRHYLIEYGGVDSFNDLSQIIRLSLKGYSGFTSKAQLYWRHHEQQTNKILAKEGYVFSEKIINTLISDELEKLYCDLNHADLYQKVTRYVKEVSAQHAKSALIISAQTYGFVSSVKSFVNVIDQTQSLRLKLYFFYILIKHNCIRILYNSKTFFCSIRK